MLRPVQKKISWMIYVVSKFSQSETISMYPFGGSFAISNGCMCVPMHRRCITGNLIPYRIKNCMVQLVEVYLRQLLNPNSKLSSSDEIQTAEHLVTQSVDFSHARNHGNRWSASTGLLPLQFFRQHILHGVSSYYEYYSLVGVLMSVPYNNWPPAWRSMFNRNNINSLLSVELTTLGLEPRTSTLPSGGKGIFTTNDIRSNSLVSFYYGTFIQENMTVSPDFLEVYLEGMLWFKEVRYLNERWRRNEMHFQGGCLELKG